MRLLLTGSTGFIGRYVKLYLKEVSNLDIVCTEANLINPLFHGFYGDFDYIINLASISSVPKSIEKPIEVIKTNTQIALNVFEYARKCLPKIVIHFSSVEADSSANPYAASKASQEAIATAYYHTYGVPIILVTSHNIIGPGQSSDKFVPKIVEYVNKGKPLQIYANNGEVGSRTYNTLFNVASALMFLLSKGSPDSLKRYLIDGGEKLNNLEMAQKIAVRLGKSLSYEIVEATTSRPGYSLFLKDRGTPLSTLGWKPPQTLDEGLSWIQ